MRFVLASASPARLATLRAAGVEPEVIVSGVDESAIQANDTAALVQRLANRKASAVSELVRGEALILGCDTLLEFGGESIGKPSSPAEAVQLWRLLRRQRAILHTGHCLYEMTTSRVSISTVKTFVHFADVTDAEIDLYVGTGEPTRVAGGFTLDGFGGWFVEGISGDHHNVVGLSLPVLRRMLRELGYTLSDIGYPGVVDQV
jgi:septum formation protein